MILMGTAPTPDQPVIVTLREALGAAIDRRQVAILRDYLDAHPVVSDTGFRAMTPTEHAAAVADALAFDPEALP